MRKGGFGDLQNRLTSRIALSWLKEAFTWTRQVIAGQNRSISLDPSVSFSRSEKHALSLA